MGIYSNLEDKWYNFLDLLDTKVPVYNVIDPVDKIFPSFIIFLIITIIVLFLIVGSFIIIKPSYTVEVTVLTNTGLPLEGVELDVFGENFTLTTNNSGKASFVTSKEVVDLRASKSDYLSVTKTFSADEEPVLKLSPAGKGNSLPSDITILVKDADKDLIINSELEINCDGNASAKTKQPMLGYNVFNNGCALFQVTARANGFEDKTATISHSNDRHVFFLERAVQKGTVFFNISSKNGLEEDVELTITNEIGQSQQHFTDSTGVIKLNLPVGKYTWSANKKSAFSNGSFELKNGEVKDVDIFLSGLIDVNTSTSNNLGDMVKEIAPKIVYNGGGVPGAKVIIYKDEELVSSRNTAYNGEISPLRISVKETSQFRGVVRANGYETKLVDLIPQTPGEKQEISLRQGGGKLRLNVYDDTNSLVDSAFVNLKINGFSGVFEEGYTDKNGQIIFENLPQKNFVVYATDNSNIDETNLDVSLEQDQFLDKNIFLITGTGSIRYRFYNEDGTSVNVSLKAFEKTDSDYELIAEDTTTREYFFIRDKKVGTKIKLNIQEPSFFPTETIPYSVMRGSQSIETFMRTSNLPNSNKIQLFLNSVYEQNPLEGGRREARRIMSGENYYLLFDLVLNNYDLATLNTNLTIDSQGAHIENVFSISGSQRVLSKTINGFIIDQVNGDIVNERALQANLFNYNQQGPKSIPFIVKMSVDENSEGKIIFNYQTKSNNEKSLEYKKEFVIGESFCLKDCPVFMYDNYIIHGGEEFPVDEKGEDVFIGNKYELKTIVHNLSSKDYSNAQLINTIKEKTEEHLKINDTNKVINSLPIKPLEKSPEKKMNLNLIDSSHGHSYIEQAVSTNGKNALDVDNSENKVKIRVRDKDQLVIVNSPNNLNAKLYYPMFFIGTKSKTGKRIEAEWQIKKIVDGKEINLGLEFSGKTDVNGESLIPLDLTNFSPGETIVLIAEGKDGTLPARKEITLGVPYGQEHVKVIPECLEIKHNGKDIIGEHFTIDVNSNVTINVNSNCDKKRRVEFITDLFVSDKTLEIPKGENKSITITGKPKDDLLGVYPVQIFTDRTSNGNYIGLFDIILKDSNSCFDLEQAIFDMEKTGKISSKVFNKCYKGRKDNFYPKIKSSTRAISLEYNKPGNPQEIDFNIIVIGSAIESVTQGATQANGLIIKSEDEDDSPIARAFPIGSEKDMIFNNELNEFCQTRYYDGNYNPKPEPPYDTYWGEYSNPTKPMYSLPNVKNVKSSKIQTKEKEKVQKVSFTSSVNKNPDLYEGKFVYNREKLRKEMSVIPLFEKTSKNCSDLFVLPRNVNNYVANNYMDKSSKSNAFENWEQYNLPYSRGQILNLFWGPEYYYNEIKKNPPFWEQSPLNFFAFGDSNNLKIALKKRSIDSLSGIEPTGLNDFDLTIGSNVSNNTVIIHNKNMASSERWTKNTPHFYDIWTNGEVLYEILLESCPGRCKRISETDYGNQIKGLQWFVEGKDEEDKFLDSTWGNLHNIGAGGLAKILATKGKTESFYNPFMDVGDDAEESVMFFQIEEHKVTEQFVERKNYWEKEANINSIEGKIYDLGRYNATPTPKATNLDKWVIGGWESNSKFDMRTGIRLDDGKGLVVPQCLHPNNFVDLERNGIHSEEGCIITPNGNSDCEKEMVWGRYNKNYNHKYFIPHYIIRPAEDPLVEYDASGKIMYYIDQESIPGWEEGNPYVRVFLRKGHVYAEYIGLPEIESNVIDFNIIRENLIGSEYSILTVQDWINNEEKISRNYQIKLTGPKSSCIGVDGKEGQSGKDFVPNLLFDWSWNNITSSQCEVDSAFSNYCDATQFTISMFKKLNEIEQLLKGNLINRIPEKVSFYAYLIKDNYSENFLNDFEDYYTNEFLEADTQFTQKMHKLIEEDRYELEVKRDSEETKLPYGGVYRVEIDITYDNSLNKNLFTNEEPTASVKIVLTPVEKAPNYNIFHELAINGNVGEKTRENYGLRTTGDELKISTNKKIYEFDNAMRTINIQKNNSIEKLSTGTIFKHDKHSDTIYLLPSQPTPVTMSVKSDDGKANALYTISNDAKNEFINQEWSMTDSTIGRRECIDFEGEETVSLKPSLSGDKYKFSWNGYLDGTLTLSTIFFTPKESNHIIKPVNENTIELKSYDYLQNATSVILGKFDEKGINDYDALENIVNGIKEQKYCISKDDEAEIWWNREYLSNLISEINRSRSHSCK